MSDLRVFVAQDATQAPGENTWVSAKGGKQGHLGNFIRVSEIKKLYPGLDLSSPLGTAIDYMLKQLDAALILYSTQRESVTGEGIEERLKDVAVYAILGILLRRDETTPVAAPKP